MVDVYHLNHLPYTFSSVELGICERAALRGLDEAVETIDGRFGTQETKHRPAINTDHVMPEQKLIRLN